MTKQHTPQPCMYDHNGRSVAEWLPEMQSAEFLRASISRGVRTDECWAMLLANQRRVHAARAVIAKLAA